MNTNCNLFRIIRFLEIKGVSFALIIIFDKKNDPILDVLILIHTKSAL